MSKSLKVPTYRCHKARGLAVVTIDGRSVYLGPFGSPESHTRYAEEIAKWERTHAVARGGQAPGDYTCGRLALDYLRYADGYYRKHGQPTSQIHQVRQALKALVGLYETDPAATFGPVKLKNLQQHLIGQSASRTYINKLVGCLKLAFRWAASEELVPAATYHALQTVSGLKRDRCGARETDPVRPVDDGTVNETVKHLSPVVEAMVNLQLLSGMRPGEVCSLRPCDVTFNLDGTGVYRPESHKTEHHGRERRVYLGPRALAILKPFLNRASEACCFSPRESVAWHRAQHRANRQTPLFASHAARYDRQRRQSPRRAAGDRFTAASYNRAIQRGAEAAFGMPAELRKIDPALPADRQAELKRQARDWRRRNCWSANQLRHNAATLLRKRFGVEGSQVVLGHSDPRVTLVYAERDFAAAAKIMAEVG